MKQIIRKKWFGYTFFGILVTVGLLYHRFPSGALQNYLEAQVDRANLRWTLSIGEVSPSLAFGLRFLETEISHQKNPDRILFRAERLFVRPSPWSLRQGKWKFCFDGLAYNGALEGCVQFMKNGSGSPFTTTIALKDIRIGGYDNLQTLIGRNIKGRLDGTVTFRGEYNVLVKGRGEADLRLSDGRLELLQPILSFDAIDFSQVSIKMILRNQKINLTRVELKGQNMRGTLSGTVSLKKEFFKSSLDLKGTIEPFADFFKSLKGTRDTVKLFRRRLKRGTLSFVIRGTLREPRIRFI